MKGSETLPPQLREAMVAALPRLRRFARALAADDDLGDDIVRQTIERALKSIPSFQAGAKPDSRMYRIARNLWIERTRNERAGSAPIATEDGLGRGGDDDQPAAELELTPLEIRQAFAKLPAEQRALVIVVMVEGQSGQEAAETLDIPVGTVMGRLSRARAALEARLFG